MPSKLYRPNETQEASIDKKRCPACFGDVEKMGHHPHVGTIFDCTDCKTKNLAPTWLMPSRPRFMRLDENRLCRRVYEAEFGEIDTETIEDEVLDMWPRHVCHYAAIEIEGLDTDEWASRLNQGFDIVDVESIRNSLDVVENAKYRIENPKTTNWELDEEIVQILVDEPAWDGDGVDAHHGDVSGYIERLGFINIPWSKVKKLESQTTGQYRSSGNLIKEDEILYQVAGAFHLRERRMQRLADDERVSYLKWGKGKEKFEEMNGESYDAFIERVIEKHGRQPWMSSNPGWSVDDQAEEEG